MRLVALLQAREVSDQPGYHDGFQRLLADGVLSDYRAIPFYGVARDHGWLALWEETERLVRALGSDAVFLQFFHGPIPDPTEGIRRLLSCPSRPTLFTSLGDPFGVWLKRIPRSYRVASQLAHLNFLTSLGPPARQLARRGSRNLVLMPHGVCQVRFADPPGPEPKHSRFDVVLIGSRMRSRYGVGSGWWIGRRRAALVGKLTERYGDRFGLFGIGWEGQRCWQGSIPFARQQEAIRQSRVQIGGPPNTMNEYYTSDREFIAMAAGVPLVDFWVPGIERFFEPGREWWLGRSLDQMLDQVDELLTRSPDELRAIGRAARREVLAHHTQYDRCRQMLAIVAQLRAHRLAGTPAPVPELPFLRFPLADRAHPLPAVVNWCA